MNSATVKVVLPLDWPFIGGKTIIIRKKLLIALLLFGLTFKYGVPNLHYIFMYIQLIISKIYQKVIKSIVALSRKRKSRRNDEMVPSEEGKITATVTLTNIGMYMFLTLSLHKANLKNFEKSRKFCFLYNPHPRQNNMIQIGGCI